MGKRLEIRGFHNRRPKVTTTARLMAILVDVIFI
jgi:hypothetical protein